MAIATPAQCYGKPSNFEISMSVFNEFSRRFEINRLRLFCQLIQSIARDSVVTSRALRGRDVIRKLLSGCSTSTVTMRAVRQAGLP